MSTVVDAFFVRDSVVRLPPMCVMYHNIDNLQEFREGYLLDFNHSRGAGTENIFQFRMPRKWGGGEGEGGGGVRKRVFL